MRGLEKKQEMLFSYLSPEKRVPKDHPIRRIRELCDQALGKLNRDFDRMYDESMGRPSIPPERVLKSQVLIALYSVRSERQFCEVLDYNLLFRWFLGMTMDEASFDPTVFTKNRERLLEHEVARRFFEATVAIARDQKLISEDHFTVDGTLIEAWASMKSFQAKDETKRKNLDDDSDSGNRDVNFRGEKRSNDTHESTTDSEARLMRKGPGKEAKLAFSANVSMENRNGFCTGIDVRSGSGRSETEGAMSLIKDLKKKRFDVESVGADKGYHNRKFIRFLRRRKIRPHVARRINAITKEIHTTEGLDGRTTRHESYRISQRKRKRIEEIFGWMKSIGGFRRTRYRGQQRVAQHAHWVGAAYNLLRLGKFTESFA